MELLKHGSSEEHNARAELADQLGKGYCVASPQRLDVNEADYFFRILFDPQSVQAMPAHMAWTRPAFLFGDIVPVPSVGAEAKSEWPFVREYLTLMWSWPLRSVIEQIRSYPNPFPLPSWTSKAAESVNSDIRSGSGDLPSAKDIYLGEVFGLAMAASAFLVDQFSEFMSARGKAAPTSEQREVCGAMLATSIRDLARATSIAQALPGFHISCRIHTALRRDKRRPHAPNDFMDIEHAKAALPYCNYFLTDAHHAALIQSSGLTDDYACKVAGSLKSATQLLSVP